MSLLLCVALSLFAAMFLLTPQTDSRANAPSPTEDAIGAILASGGLYHANSRDLDHRALVSARIANLESAPDVLIISDRTWQLVQNDLRWERSVFGAYIDGLSPEDIQAILKQFRTQTLQPRKVILGISPDILINPPPEGKLKTPEGSDQTQRSGLATLIRDLGPNATPRPGLAPVDPELDTLFPDGSNVWSIRRTREASSVDIQRKALHLADVLADQVDRSLFTQVVAIGEVIADAKASGIEVVIALTPLHPEVYRQIHETPTTYKLHEGLEDLFSMARGLDVITLGSFEPYAAGCKARDFASVTIPGARCILRSLDAAILAKVR